MIKRTSALLIGFCLGLIALALPIMVQADPPSGAEEGNLLDDGLSPAERWQKGVRVFGVFDLQDPLRCSQVAARNNLGTTGFPPDQVLGQNVMGAPITARGFAATQRSVLEAALDELKAHGDKDVVGRHICTGLGSFGERGANAVSLEAGYIVSDPRIVNLINALPNRTMFSLDMIVVHELAHQFQYWYGNPFKNDSRVRRSELAADCVAASLIAVRWTQSWTLQFAADGVVAASVAVGDLEYQGRGHHGTPVEREIAAVQGVNMALQQLRDGTRLGSRQLLAQCNAFVAERDASQGPNWKKETAPTSP